MLVTDEVVFVRCTRTTCNGLFGVSARHAPRVRLCPNCRRGKVIPRSRYHNYWLERFSLDEIRELAHAIWG